MCYATCMDIRGQFMEFSSLLVPLGSCRTQTWNSRLSGLGQANLPAESASSAYGVPSIQSYMMLLKTVDLFFVNNMNIL